MIEPGDDPSDRRTLGFAANSAATAPYWTADTSRHPLVVVHLVGSTERQQPDTDSLLSIVDGFIRSQQQIAVVYDLTGSRPDAQRRQTLVTWLKRNADRHSRCVIASAIVTPTAFHRGLLVATLWFVRPRRPVQLFGERSSAIAWAFEQLKRAGLATSLETPVP